MQPSDSLPVESVIRGDAEMVTKALENGRNAKYYRTQAALNAQRVDQKLADLSRSRSLNADQLAAVMEAWALTKDVLRWLEADGSGTLPREI